MRRVGGRKKEGREEGEKKVVHTTRHGAGERGAARRWRGTPGGVPIGVCQPLGVCPSVPRARQRGVVLCSSSTARAFAGDRRSTSSGGGQRGGCLGSRADPSGECLDSVAGVSSTALSLSLTRSHLGPIGRTSQVVSLVSGALGLAARIDISLTRSIPSRCPPVQSSLARAPFARLPPSRPRPMRLPKPLPGPRRPRWRRLRPLGPLDLPPCAMRSVP